MALEGQNSFRQSTTERVDQSDIDFSLSQGPMQKTLAIIKPDAMHPSAIEQILGIIKRSRFQILDKRKIWMSKELVAEFYKEHAGQSFFSALLSYLSA
jgi:nucleoside diphosphate kinase